jgi:acyl dehydratase
MTNSEPEILAGASAAIGYLSEMTTGQRYTLGATRISLDAALEFSRALDPFSFHVDEEAAKSTMFGGLIVSGLHTLSAIHALSIRGGFLVEPCVVCGAGIDEIRFTQPVRPGDVLSAEAEVIELKQPKPGRKFGVARLKYLVTNDREQTVMTFIDNHVLLLNRP